MKHKLASNIIKVLIARVIARGNYLSDLALPPTAMIATSVKNL